MRSDAFVTVSMFGFKYTNMALCGNQHRERMNYRKLINNFSIFYTVISRFTVGIEYIIIIISNIPSVAKGCQVGHSQ